MKSGANSGRAVWARSIVRIIPPLIAMMRSRSCTDSMLRMPHLPNALRAKRDVQPASSIPNVITIYDFGTIEQTGALFIAMEYVEGQTLKDVIRQGPLEFGRAVNLTIQIADGLHAVHQEGIIHRDVKPDNIVVQPGDKVKLMDFGISRSDEDHTRSHVTATGLIVGTPAYMAPEQAQAAEITVRTDIYALGIVLYEMLSGKVPFSAPSAVQVLMQHINEKPRPLRELRPDVPRNLERIVLQALQQGPEKAAREHGSVLADRFTQSRAETT